MKIKRNVGFLNSDCENKPMVVSLCDRGIRNAEMKCYSDSIAEICCKTCARLQTNVAGR